MPLVPKWRNATRHLKIDELLNSPALNPHVTIRPFSVDEKKRNPTPNPYAARRPQMFGPLKSPTVNPHVTIRPFSVDEQERIPTVQHSRYPPTPFPSI
ncbi:hypothetical protein JTE90_001831 [Oedothorax gibbosus]|uniref:Uncharacterized protein n=1 Tax=Oedothorax gibbosus TaxID=931172 RepID=A0AAV6U3G5_9ARAC|nr:hypothetical protein JTE90_001831 [Oedothorax gibbosus]